MPSSKKKNRNKQGKGGSGHAKKSSTPVPSPNQRKHEQCFEKNMKTCPPDDVVGRIRSGMALSTAIVSDLLAGHDHNNKIEYHKYLQRLVEVDLIPVVLALLGRCVDEQFDDVVETDGLAFIGGECEGRVAAPSVWIALLLNVAGNEECLGASKRDECRIQIAQEIGPLVMCMCDDMKRGLFHSNKHWHKAFLPFVTLVYDLAGTDSAIPILMTYDGLVDILAQCIFWGEHRRDILTESEAFKHLLINDNFSLIADYAGAILGIILKSNEKFDGDKFYYEENGKECNMNIGTTVIVRKSYDASCDVMFVSGLIGLLKSKGRNRVYRSDKFLARAIIRNMLTMLMVSGCVDKTVITGIIDFGTNHAVDYDEALWATKTSNEMVLIIEQGKRAEPNHLHFAAAISSGLFEMFLHILPLYGRHPSNGKLIQYIDTVLQSAIGVASRKVVSNAIKSCRPGVLKALQSSERQLNGQCKGTVLLMKSVLNMNEVSNEAKIDFGRACNNCAKVISPSEAEFCSRCHKIPYCSKECQVADWKMHKRNCVAGKTKIAKATEQNVCAIGEKIARNNAGNAMAEATIKGYDFLDCLVEIDLRVPKIEVQLINEYVGSNVATYHTLLSLLEKNKNVVAFIIKLNDSGPTSSEHVLTIPNNWEELQAANRRNNHFVLQMLDEHPDRREQYLAKVKQGYRYD